MMGLALRISPDTPDCRKQRFERAEERLLPLFLTIPEPGENRNSPLVVLKSLSQDGVDHGVALHVPETGVHNTTTRYGILFRHHGQAGTPIPTDDLWIALVVQHDLTLCSRDAHFDAILQLPRVTA